MKDWKNNYINLMDGLNDGDSISQSFTTQMDKSF